MAKAFDFKQVIEFMEEYGFYDVILPFLLVFTLIFATLQKIKLFGKESRRYNAIIALSISLIFVAASNLVEELNKNLPIIGVVLAAFLGIMLLLGLFGVKEESSGTRILGWVITGGVILAIGFNYLSEWEGSGGIFEFLGDYSTSLIIFGVILGIIIAVIKGGGEKETKSSKD